MEFRLLGSVEVSSGGSVVGIGGAKPRTLLVSLLVDHGRVVPANRLLDALWGEHPPGRARSILQTYVSSLRQVTNRTGGRAAITTRSPGYVLDIPDGALDRDVFERLVTEGRQAAGSGRHAEAAELFRRGLALWRGPALGGVESELLVGEAARLDEMRLAALEERIGSELALSRLAEVVAELTDLVSRHPFRERMRGHLMTALCGLGRQSDALAVYRVGRARLTEELGIEPGPELRAIHARILRGGTSGALPARPSAADRAPGGPRPEPAGEGRPPAPAQLPPAPADFVGRDAELGALVTALTRPDRTTAVPVQVIVGRGGIGKSALAAHVAHRVVADHPDGQLYADLSGLGPVPAEPYAVLGRFLRALDGTTTVLPETTEERAERFRTLVAGRRLLIMLDDARDERQVRPLLPGAASCAVVVTSRRHLAGLAGCAGTELGPLGDTDASALLADMIGAERAAAEPDAARRVVTLCGGLPLAIRVAGARLASRRRWPVALLAGRLADEELRLDELSAGDQDVRSCLARSYDLLDPPARAALRLVGLLGLSDFPSWVLAAALDVTPAEAEQVAERLVDALLVDPIGVDDFGQIRYGTDDLVRLFGRDRGRAEDAERAVRRAAARVAATWYALRAAVEAGGPARSGALPVADSVLDRIGVHPRAWLGAEHAALSTVLRLAVAPGNDEAVVARPAESRLPGDATFASPTTGPRRVRGTRRVAPPTGRSDGPRTVGSMA
ncbi:Regulatory protein AfsR [Micromonospora sp. MW-13]|uniref:AfsR/SARP family transcriptional regulator n=1 Tax=Micromonospora sp. MW-13 TaxID=2094022 RepID=UPI000E440A4B|nr:AfsR/SARP family transcriptional regulator [Micromonospora sp. MW-13]RGC65015.1 Regulatory protein AfsR [Micromonospora sp. MW-13]